MSAPTYTVTSVTTNTTLTLQRWMIKAGGKTVDSVAADNELFGRYFTWYASGALDTGDDCPLCVSLNLPLGALTTEAATWLYSRKGISDTRDEMVGLLLLRLGEIVCGTDLPIPNKVFFDNMLTAKAATDFGGYQLSSTFQRIRHLFNL